MQEIIIIRVGGRSVVWAGGRLGASKRAGRLRCMFCCKKKVGTSVNEKERERERGEIVVLFLNVPVSIYFQ